MRGATACAAELLLALCCCCGQASPPVAVVPSAAAGTSERERTTDSTAVAPREATLGVRERVVLPGAGAPAYSTTRIASPAEPVADDIVDRLLASRPSWRERRDGRLDRLAATLLAIAIEHEALGASIVDEARSFQGVPEPTPVAVYLARGELASLVRELGVALSEVGAGLDRFGIAARAEAGGWRVLGVASRQSVEIEPVPRHVAASGELELIGRLLVPVRSLALVVTRPDGTVTRLPMTIQARQRFSVRLDLPAPGRHTVEVVAVDPRGPRPILILPVHVGEPPPSGVELAVTGLESRDPGELEAHLLALVNAARQEAGLPPVSPHPGLADVARRYSNEMARTGQVAHVSSRSGGIADRLQRAGLAFPAVHENLALAGSAREAHEGLMRSPDHRRAVLAPSITLAGIGVAVIEADGGARIVVTELFASER